MTTSRRGFVAGLGMALAAISIPAMGSEKKPDIKDYSERICDCFTISFRKPMTKESMDCLDRDLKEISDEIVKSGICHEYRMGVDEWFSPDGKLGVVKIRKVSRKSIDDESKEDFFSVLKFPDEFDEERFMKL